jgi:hypothetical protein
MQLAFTTNKKTYMTQKSQGTMFFGMHHSVINVDFDMRQKEKKARFCRVGTVCLIILTFLRAPCDPH